MPTSKPSSLVTEKNTEMIEESQTSLPTWSIVIFLIIVFFMVKKLIYTPDPKRDGK